MVWAGVNGLLTAPDAKKIERRRLCVCWEGDYWNHSHPERGKNSACSCCFFLSFFLSFFFLLFIELWTKWSFLSLSLEKQRLWTRWQTRRQKSEARRLWGLFLVQSLCPKGYHLPFNATEVRAEGTWKWWGVITHVLSWVPGILGLPLSLATK